MNKLNLKLILEAIDKITAPITKMKNAFTANLKKMQASAETLGKSLEKMGKKMTEAGNFFTTRLSLPIAGFGFLAVRSAGQVEELSLRFEGLAGSADKAGVFVKQLIAFTEKSPFQMDDVSNAAAALLSAGYATEEATKRLKMMGDVATGAKTSLSDVVNTYLGLRLKGKADASDLAGMVNKGIPIVAALAKQMGKTTKEIYNLGEAGDISFSDIRKAMEAMTSEGGVFFNKMEKQTRSIFGIVDEFKKSIGFAFADIGGELWRELEIGDKIKSMTATIRSLAESFMALPKPVKSFVIWAGVFLAILGPVLIVIGQLTVGLGLMFIGFAKMIPVLAAVGNAIYAVGAALIATPLGQAILLITAFAAAGYLLVKHWDKVKTFFISFWESVKSAFASSIEWIMDKLQPLLNGIAKVREGWGKVQSAVSDNPLTRTHQRMFGDQPAAPNAQAAPVLPVGTVGGTQRVDTGGTLKITIDSEGKAQVKEVRPNDRRMGFTVGSGQLMGGAY